MRKFSLSVAALVALGSAAYAADAGGDFIATWAASPQPIWGADFLVPVKVPRNFWNQTLREVATISQGGKQVRLVLSNLYGTMPLPIAAAHAFKRWTGRTPSQMRTTAASSDFVEVS